MTELVQRDLNWARKITERLRLQATNYAEAREKVVATLTEAREGGAAELLGYASWTTYMADVFGDAPLRLEGEARRDMASELAAEGMPVPAIAKVLGVADRTVQRDFRRSEQVVTPVTTSTPTVNVDTGEVIEQEPRTAVEEYGGATPPNAEERASVRDKITGLDGKQYTRPEPKEPRPKASPITDRFTSAVTDLNRLLDRFHRITEDQAFRRNTDTIRGLHRADINRAIRELQTLADAL